MYSTFCVVTLGVVSSLISRPRSQRNAAEGRSGKTIKTEKNIKREKWERVFQNCRRVKPRVSLLLNSVGHVSLMHSSDPVTCVCLLDLELPVSFHFTDTSLQKWYVATSTVKTAVLAGDRRQNHDDTPHSSFTRFWAHLTNISPTRKPTKTRSPCSTRRERERFLPSTWATC